MDWLKPYDGLIESESHLIEVINIITKQANNQTNQTTSIPPIKLFDKEKEYLNPLPNTILLETYLNDIVTHEVPPTLLVNYKGNGYSVPSKLIGKRVKLVPSIDKLYIYFNTELVICHNITNQKFNYDKSHYIEGLSNRLNNKGYDIEEMAEKNLKLFENKWEK